MADIIDIEELIDEFEKEQKKPFLSRKKSDRKPTAKELSGTHDLKSNYSFLYGLSRDKVVKYIKGTNKYKTINKQIELLGVELKEYHRLGRKDLFDATKAMMDSLRDSIKDLTTFSSEKNIRAAREERKEKVRNSKYINALKKEITEIREELKTLRPSSLSNKFKDLTTRLNINLSNVDYVDIDDLDVDDIDMDDLDNLERMESKSDSDLYKEYIALCDRIAGYIGRTGAEVYEMTPTAIKRELENSPIVDEYMDKKSKYSDKNTELMIAMSDITSDPIARIIYDNFDFEIESEVNDAIDLLAASKTGFVANMAYVLCRKYGVLSEVDNIVGYGLIALSEAINRWKKYQKIAYKQDKNNIIDIDLFLGINVTGPMIKGIYELKNKGMINPSMSITMDMEKSKNFEKFKKDNPDLAGLPDEQIRSVYEYQMLNNSGLSGNVLNTNVSVSTETEFGDLIASSIQEQDSDLWSNMMIDKESMSQFKSVDNFNDILRIIEIIFGLYKLAYDRKTGDVVGKSNKMFFDKIDYSIFKKILGIEHNPDDPDGRWTQERMSVELTDEFGKTFTQGAVGYRINQIQKILKKDIIEDYPNLSGAIEDLRQFFLIKNNVSIFQSMIEENPQKFEKVEENILKRLK